MNTDPCCAGREDTVEILSQKASVSGGYAPMANEPVFAPQATPAAAGHAGFGPRGGGGEVSVNLEVGGMTCMSCVDTVTAALMRSPGVRHANVKLPGSAHVKCAPPRDPSADLTRPLVGAVEAAGYTARAAYPGL